MRSRDWFLFAAVLIGVAGCGGNKVELPKETVDAPKNVKAVGGGSGAGGLPKPPDSIPDK